MVSLVSGRVLPFVSSRIIPALAPRRSPSCLLPLSSLSWTDEHHSLPFSHSRLSSSSFHPPLSLSRLSFPTKEKQSFSLMSRRFFNEMNDKTSLSKNQRYGKLMRSHFNEEGHKAVSTLSPQQRVLAYYLSRAAISSYRIALFQLCPFPHLLDVLAKWLDNHFPSSPPPSPSPSSPSPDSSDFYHQVLDWWVYLFSNFGVHCQRESECNKKTPQKHLDLPLITRERLEKEGLSLSESEWDYLLNENWFPTATVPGSIESSGSSFFPPNYRQEWYDRLPEEERESLIGYHTEEGMKRYGTKGVCGSELSDVVKWLKKAKEWSEQHPDIICPLMGESLGLLILHFETGKEDYFREHCKVWVKMKNDVEYCAGFIESYDDPMSQIGTFQADVTMKSHDIAPLLEKIPFMERELPFPDEFKRDSLFSSSQSEENLTIPNAIPSHKLIGIGGLGPLFSTLAYCLPNYSDIRDEVGSKQVMYPTLPPNDPERYLALYYCDEDRELFERYSPDLGIGIAVSSLSTILHETIGHGSGKGVSEKVRSTRLGKWANGLEEMRAEILALYTGIRFYDIMCESGCLGDWPQRVPKDFILRLMVHNVAGNGWRRWKGLPSGSTSVSQAHALADTGIMYYLMDHCPEHLSLTRDIAKLPETEVPVLRFKIGSVSELFPHIERLAQKVQKMSSLAETEEVDQFMRKYACDTRDSEFTTIVTEMNSVLDHGVIETVNVFSELELVKNQEGEVVDALAVVPENHFEYFRNIFEMSRPSLEP